MKISHPTKAVLFDLDGTLLDTAPDFAHCLNQMLAKEKKPLLQTKDMKPWVSHGVKGMVESAFQIDDSSPQLQSLMCQLGALYTTYLGQFSKLFPGVLTLLEALEHKGIAWGIVTNKPMRFAEPLLRQFKLLNRAQCAIYGDTLPTRKPDPATILLGCQLLNVVPSTCLYVGDSLSDAQASLGAGIPYILAQYGYIPPDEDLSTWPIFKKINHPKDVLPLIA